MNGERQMNIDLPKDDYVIPFYGNACIDSYLPYAFYLYTDLIHPMIVASKNESILKLIPILSNVSTFYESHHLDFVPVSNNRLSYVHFQLRMPNGQLVPFTPDTVHVELCLLFKKI